MGVVVMLPAAVGLAATDVDVATGAAALAAKLTREPLAADGWSGREARGGIASVGGSRGESDVAAAGGAAVAPESEAIGGDDPAAPPMQMGGGSGSSATPISSTESLDELVLVPPGGELAGVASLEPCGADAPGVSGGGPGCVTTAVDNDSSHCSASTVLRQAGGRISERQ